MKWGKGRCWRVNNILSAASRPDLPLRAPGREEQLGSYKCPLSRNCADSTESYHLRLPVPLRSCHLRVAPGTSLPPAVAASSLAAPFVVSPYTLLCGSVGLSALLLVLVPLGFARGLSFLGSLASRALHFQARLASWICHSATPVCFPSSTLTTS